MSDKKPTKDQPTLLAISILLIIASLFILLSVKLTLP